VQKDNDVDAHMLFSEAALLRLHPSNDGKEIVVRITSDPHMLDNVYVPAASAFIVLDLDGLRLLRDSADKMLTQFQARIAGRNH